MDARRGRTSPTNSERGVSVSKVVQTRGGNGHARGFGEPTETTSWRDRSRSVPSYGGVSMHGGDRNLTFKSSVVLNINENPGHLVSSLFTDESGESDDGKEGLGTFDGVYKPTCLMMWGVIIFIRFGEIVGQAGIGLCLLFVVISAVCVGLTTSSVSALVSNGVPSGKGGVYTLLTRSLGSSIGGSFSVLYFLGLTAMSCVEMVGFTEGLHQVVYDKVGHSLTGSAYIDQKMVVLTVFISFWVVLYIGNRLKDPLSAAFLFICISAYLAAFTGLFASIGGWATGDHYVPEAKMTVSVTGLSFGNFKNNFGPDFAEKYSFSTVLTFIFPCFIGIFRGAGIAHRLKSPARSVPTGVFGAILTSTLFYTFIICLLGSVAPRNTLKYDFLLFERVSWPSPWVTIAGVLVVPLGSGLEFLELAEGILKVVAEEGILPFLQPLGLDKENKQGRAMNALAGSMLIALPLLFIPELDTIALVVTMLYLLNYAAVNFTCFLVTVLGDPSWRPHFRFFHKYWTALPGFIMCTAIMLAIAWWAAVASFVFFVLLAVYIEVKSDANIWGYGVRGLRLHMALRALVGMEGHEMGTGYRGSYGTITSPDMTDTAMDGVECRHSKLEDGRSEGVEGSIHYAVVPWRPQVLAMVKMANDSSIGEVQQQLLSFVHMLTKSCAKGSLLIVGNVIVKDPDARATQLSERTKCREMNLRRMVQRHKLSGFVEVVTAPDVDTGISMLLQTAGLGTLRPNTIVVAWPDEASCSQLQAQSVVQLIAQAKAENKAILLAKGLEEFPTVDQKVLGYLDIWWVVQEGGLLLLVGHLLKQHPTWRNCRMRVFTVAGAMTDTVAIGNGLAILLKNLRIQAEVHVVEISGNKELEPFLAEFTVTKSHHTPSSSQLVEKPRPGLATVFPSCVGDLQALVEERGRTKGVGDGDTRGMVSNSCTLPSASEPYSQGSSGLQQPSTVSTPLLSKGQIEFEYNDAIVDESDTQGGELQQNHAKEVNEVDVAAQKPFRRESAAANKSRFKQHPPSRRRYLGDEFYRMHKEAPPPQTQRHELVEWSVPELKEAVERESGDSALVILNLPVPNRSALSHAEEYVSLVNDLVRKLPRAILAHGLGDGTQVISVFNH